MKETNGTVNHRKVGWADRFLWSIMVDDCVIKKRTSCKGTA